MSKLDLVTEGDTFVVVKRRFEASPRAGGGTVESEFRTQGPMPVAFCSDPFGNGFCVIGDRAS